MEGRDARRGLAPDGTERILVSSAISAHHLAAELCRQLETAGLVTFRDDITRDTDPVPPATSLQRLQKAAACVLVISGRCNMAGWRDALIARGLADGIPPIVLFEAREQEWQGCGVPALVTSDPQDILAFMARSRPDVFGLREFLDELFGNRTVAQEFRRASPSAWRWRRQSETAAEATTELTLCDAATEPLAAATPVLVEAASEQGLPVMQVGYSDNRRYRLAYSREIRAVLPAPVWPSIEPIGFMHCDFDTGREWPRAGKPPVELRMLGRAVYGWHMSEYFWRAFVGNLPKLLGRNPEGSRRT